ncbi:thymidylate synthase [Proteus columbae]|uniref:thymidylate synthase n=1 Tax=Proteus columbae TaxID=1987580 RepID=UPI00288C5914|nr:thymidylate synthase [Proteus columbae]
MEAYKSLASGVLRDGRVKGNVRTGTTTRSIMSCLFKHDMAEGFPLLTTKKMKFSNVVAEWLWITNGYTNVDFLHALDCHIWDMWALKEDHYGEVPMTTLERIQYYLNKHNHVDFQDHLHMYSEEELVAKLDALDVPKTKTVLIARKGETNAPYGRAMRKRNANGETPMEYIDNLIAKAQDSRRIMSCYWDHADLPDETLSVQDNIKAGRPCLTPCHFGHQVYIDDMTLQERWMWYKAEVGPGERTLVNKGILAERQGNDESAVKTANEILDKYNIPRRRLNLKWNQRSVDTGIGLGYNIAYYALTLAVYAHRHGLATGFLEGDLTNVHIYESHVSGLMQQYSRSCYKLPRLNIKRRPDSIHDYTADDFELVGYEHHPFIKFELYE